MNTKLIIRPALVTIAILLVPFLAVAFNWNVYDPGSGYEQINWDLADFVVMGVLVFCTGLLVELALKTKSTYRIAAAIVIILGFLWLWAELAVGVFTNWGS